MVDNSSSTDRPRGILSGADRTFLTATEKEREENYSRQARSKRKQAIQERVYNGILDFTYLMEFWSEDARHTVFEEVLDEWRGRVALADMIAIYYLELIQRERFDEFFGQGVRQAEASKQDDEAEVFVSVRPIDELVERVEQETIEEAIMKFGQGDLGLFDMTEAETRVLAYLFQLSDVGPEVFEEIFMNLQRGQFEQQGGWESVRKDEWKRAMLRSGKPPEDMRPETTDPDNDPSTEE